MSVMTYNFESDYLKNNQEIVIILPDKPRRLTPTQFFGSGEKYKVLWLLHGAFGDSSDWLRKTNIELYATERNLAVVMPSGLNSNYSNWNDFMLGYRMFDYLTEELMPLIYGWLPISDRREDNFIAGRSSGGRGAIKYAVNHPDKFAAMASLSSVPLDFNEISPTHPNPLFNCSDPKFKTSIDNAGGLEAYCNSIENTWVTIDKLVSTGTLPRLMFACGTEDALFYQPYVKYQKHAKEIGLDAHWFTLEGYRHEWRFWDLAIQNALSFFYGEL